MALSKELKEYDVVEVKCVADDDIGGLGSGSYGTVRLGFIDCLGVIAIKCFSVTVGGKAKLNVAKKMKKELELIQKAHHPCIITVYGWTKWPMSIALIMEYMAGGDLRNLLLDDSIEVAPNVRLQMATDVSSGISFIHNLPGNKLMVHGDLKPENILLNKNLRCKLSDFGSGTIVSLTGSTTATTSKKGKKVELTLAYSAPERLANVSLPLKKEQDTYSFGMILHMLLTRATPIRLAVELAAYLELVKQGKRPDTSAINKFQQTVTSKEKVIITLLDEIMRQCWQQIPARRPEMTKVRDELQSLLNKQNEPDILRQVITAVEEMDLSVPTESEERRVPLHYFSSTTGQFDQAASPAALSPTAPSATTSATMALSATVSSSVAQQQFGSSSTAGQGGNGIAGRKPTLEEVFEKDPSGLPSNVRPAPGFLEKYKISLKKQNYEEAKTMTTKITSMIEDNIDATAKDVEEFGIKLREKKLFLESIAIFDAASAMFEKMRKTEEKLEWMTICVQEMRDTNKAMIGDDASMKVTVKNFIIPLMREKLRHIEDTSLVSEQFKCLKVCEVLLFIEYSEGLVGELEEREKTLRFALTRMKDVFKADALKFQIYGVLLNDLGCVCGRTSRFEEAASFYKRAIDAYKAATDYSDEEERKKDIAMSENNLKVVQQKMK